MIKQPETTSRETSGTQSSKLLLLSSTSASTSGVETTTSTLPLIAEGAYNRLYFFFDPDLNNVRDEMERLFGGLNIFTDGTSLDFQNEGYVDVPKNKVVNLQIEGVAPNGKALTNCTSSEPLKPVPLAS
jgi:hypothetical protein